MGRNSQRINVISAKSKELSNQNMDDQWLPGLRQSSSSEGTEKGADTNRLNII